MKSRDETDKIIENRFRKMTAGQKLNLSLLLYSSARELKKSAIKQFHPELSNSDIEERVREIFLYART